MRVTLLVAALVLAFSVDVSAASPPGEGSKAFTARPKFGAAIFNLPAVVHWRSTALPNGRFDVVVDATVNLAPVLANIKQLSAQALNRDIPCATLVRVQQAFAQITSPRTVRYDLRFRYAKRVCAGGLPLELPADVACTAVIAGSAARSMIVIDVKGATEPPCRIIGASQAMSQAILGLVGGDVFKHHVIDLAKILPREFQGVTIDIRTLAFDPPPAPATLHVGGESVMSQAQYVELMARLNAARARSW